ncbi:hypothetical protein [Ruminococcus sp.]|uniref:hypothetical protein n=1 Tax=Ruminococcus sp. TaxID=41978 RepID=UPI002E80ECB2|nr:hypothetical protein [Ruminococcus sp.]MEE3491942.1 hypothetical protein [Ruminococcus sp.]
MENDQYQLMLVSSRYHSASDGLKQFNEEGISKITSLLKDDFGGLAERIKAIIRVSQNYKSYSGLTDQMDGEVKFIYKTAEIE